MADSIIPMRISHEDGVDGESVRDAVYALVDFQIPDHVYLSIDRAMCKFWNDDTEVKGTFNTEELHTYVSKFVEKERILYPLDKVRRIVDAIISYLTMVGIIGDI